MRRLAHTLAFALLAVPLLAAAPPVHDARSLTKEQFAALPDTAILDVKGARVTAGELRARAKRNADARAAIKPAAIAKTRARAAALAVKLSEAEASRIQAANALRQKLYAAIGDGPHVEVRPEIRSIEPGSIEPKAYVVLAGDGFGAKPGQVLLKGLPGGTRALEVDASGWKPNAVAATVPDVSGVKEQSVTIEVVRKDGKTSEKTVRFVPAKETRLVDTVVHCAHESTYEDCETDGMFYGAHTEDTLWETDGTGCDAWSVRPLKNGWVIQSFDVTEMSNGGGRVGGMQKPYPMPATSHAWNACWTVPGTGGYSGNTAAYLGFIEIVGPKGVPHY